MNAVIESESTLTDRYQTTVPEPVRRALHLRKRDKIRYEIRADGEVVVSRAGAAPEDENDPALAPFLGILARDIANNPQRVRAFDSALVARLQRLVEGVEVDLDSALSPEDE